jgi:hypothetical protein
MNKIILTTATVFVGAFILSGCASDGTGYRSVDPNTCITTPLISSGCTESQASVNRAKFFAQCKNMDGTPSMRTFPNASLGKEPILGVNCLMPDGTIRDLYGEKFKETTGKELIN